MCHRARHTFPQEHIRSVSFGDEPHMRASDADRERVVEALRKHAADGRLSVAELEQRSASAYGARTLAELAPLLVDLPEPTPLAWARPRGVSRPAVRPIVLVAAVLIAVWAATGFGFFWPLWPILAVLWFAGPRAYGRRAVCARPRRRVGGPAPWSGPERFHV
jgi:hypothetical protein